MDYFASKEEEILTAMVVAILCYLLIIILVYAGVAVLWLLCFCNWALARAAVLSGNGVSSVARRFTRFAYNCSILLTSKSDVVSKQDHQVNFLEESNSHAFDRVRLLSIKPPKVVIPDRPRRVHFASEESLAVYYSVDHLEGQHNLRYDSSVFVEAKKQNVKAEREFEVFPSDAFFDLQEFNMYHKVVSALEEDTFFINEKGVLTHPAQWVMFCTDDLPSLRESCVIPPGFASWENYKEYLFWYHEFYKTQIKWYDHYFCGVTMEPLRQLEEDESEEMEENGDDFIVNQDDDSLDFESVDSSCPSPSIAYLPTILEEDADLEASENIPENGVAMEPLQLLEENEEKEENDDEFFYNQDENSLNFESVESSCPSPSIAYLPALLEEDDAPEDSTNIPENGKERSCHGFDDDDKENAQPPASPPEKKQKVESSTYEGPPKKKLKSGGRVLDWPAGWTQITKPRNPRNRNKYRDLYFSPDGIKFESLKQVVAFIDDQKACGGDD